MRHPSVRSNKKTVQRQAEKREAKLRQDNEKKARQTADKLFPGEKWEKEDERIFISPRRKRSNFEEEFKDAQILRDLGSTVYLVPENNRQPGTKYDAIVNGMKFEFKNVGGNANTLATHFLRSRSQAPNVFINLDKKTPAAEQPGTVARGGLLISRPAKLNIAQKTRKVKCFFNIPQSR